MATPDWLAKLESVPVSRFEFEGLKRKVERMQSGLPQLEPWPDLGDKFPPTERYKRVSQNLAREYERGPAGQEGQLYIRALGDGLVTPDADGFRIFTGWASAGILSRALDLGIWQWVKDANEAEAERMTRAT